MKYYIANPKANGELTEVTQAEYLKVFGDANISQYVTKLYHNEISISEVPQELQEQVQDTVANRIAYFGDYGHQEVSMSELQTMLEEVM